MLQHRPAAEWDIWCISHLGQFLTTEYQALGRDRDWFGIALKEMVPELASKAAVAVRGLEAVAGARAADGQKASGA